MMGNWYGGFAGFGLLLVLGMAAIYILFLIATWRLMRAHETLALAVKEFFDNNKLKP